MCGSAPAPSLDVNAAPTIDDPNDALRTAAFHGVGPSGAEALPEFPGYETLGIIGQGGMGLVVEARDVVLNRPVAIKVPLPDRVGGAVGRARLLREARTAARLRHPHICQIHEVGEAGGMPFLVLDYIRGETLQHWARQAKPSARRVAETVAQLARAVACAHAADVIHRDIKPGNVMIESGSQRPVLMDFGLAKELAEEGEHLTSTGQVMGTAAYMAPEQAAGHSELVGPLSDVYSLGVVLYELLGDRVPFRGAYGEVIKQVQTDEPTPLRKLAPRLHRDLETICHKAMAKAPAARYANAAALAEDLERFCAGEAILARRAGLLARGWRRVRGSPALVAAIAAVLLVVAGVGFAIQRGQRDDRIAAVRQQIEAGPDAAAQLADFLTSSHAAIDGLALAPDRAAALRGDLAGRALRFVRDLPAIDSEAVEQLQAAVAQEGRRDPRVGEQLQQQLSDRLHRWDEEIDIQPPFEGLPDLFAPGALMVGATEVRRAGEVHAPTLLTRHPCPGAVRVEAEFATGWEQAKEIGLLLNAGETRGYVFVLRAATDAGGAGLPSLQSSTASGSLRLLIFRRSSRRDRDEVRLGERLIGSGSLPAGPLTLEATHAGDRLVFRINQLEPLECRDLFPPAYPDAGVVGLSLPGSVGLRRLRVWRQALPPQPSPLQRGDDLYARARYAEALAFYRQQAAALTATDDYGQEARVKQALALIALNRAEEAVQLLEDVSAPLVNGRAQAGAARWPLTAACQLWLLRLRQGRTEDAEALHAAIAAAGSTSELTAIVPPDVRDDLLARYRGPANGVNILFPDSAAVARLEQAVAVVRLLGAPGVDHLLLRLSLARAYRLAGRLDRAERVLREFLNEEPSESSFFGVSLAQEYGWLMREVGRPGDALEEINRRLLLPDGGLRPGNEWLLLERARLYAALGRWSDAEADAETIWRRQTPNSDDYRTIVGSALLRGFFLDRRGDKVAAQQAWQDGWKRIDLRRPNLTELMAGTLGMVHALILGSLSDQLSDRDAELVLENGLLPQLDSASLIAVKEVVRATPGVLRTMWRSPRGREQARQVAFLEGSLAETARASAVVFAADVFRRHAFGDAPTAEQEALAWQTAADGFLAVTSGKINRGQLVLLVTTWKGTTGAFGWGGVKGSLPLAIRGPIAYLMGHRYLRRGEPAAAADFFRTARSDAPAGSPLQQLAAAELARLPPK